MAQINITIKATIDEANLLLKLLDEGQETRQALAKQFRQNRHSGGTWKEGDANYEGWKLMGQEILAIEAMRRGFKS